MEKSNYCADGLFFYLTPLIIIVCFSTIFAVYSMLIYI